METVTTENGLLCRYAKTPAEFIGIIKVCVEYIFEHKIDDRGMGADMLTLANAMADYGTYPLLGWDKLAGSGIFHDAIGKVTNVTADYIEVTEEY